MRWLLRLGLVLGISAGFVVAADAARADITFTENAQRDFGVTADGADTDSGEAIPAMDEGWDAFNATMEGPRIWDRLDGIDGLDITIDSLTGSDVGGGRALGTARVTARDANGRPTAVLIKIRRSSPGDEISRL